MPRQSAPLDSKAQSKRAQQRAQHRRQQLSVKALVTADSDSDPMDCAHSWWACRYVAYESALGTPSTAPACPGPF